MDLFRHAAKTRRTGQPLAERMRPRDLDEFVGQAHLVGPGRILERTAIAARAAVDDPVGPAGHRQDDAGAHPRGARQRALRRAVGGAGGRQGSARRRRRGARRAWPSTASARCCSSTRSIASTRRSRTRCCRTSRRARSRSSARPRRIRRSRSTPRSCRAARSCASRARRDGLASARSTARSPTRSAGSASSRSTSPTTCATSSRAKRRATRAARCRRSRWPPKSPSRAPDGRRRVDVKAVEEALQRKTLLYDKAGEEHYNVISAFIKSMRGSDPDAAVYWMTRMIEAGEDPIFIVRRMVIFASEDIGNADPQALVGRGRRARCRAPGRAARGDAADDAGGDVPGDGAEVEHGARPPTRRRARRCKSAARCRCRCTFATRRRRS